MTKEELEKNLLSNILMVCKIKNVRPTNACDESGAGKSLVSELRNGKVPGVYRICLLAEYLGVTVSELIGEVDCDAISVYGLEPNHKARYYDRLNLCCSLVRRSVPEVTNDLEIAPFLVEQWKSDVKPLPAIAEKVANYFQLPQEFFIGKGPFEHWTIFTSFSNDLRAEIAGRLPDDLYQTEYCASAPLKDWILNGTDDHELLQFYRWVGKHISRIMLLDENFESHWNGLSLIFYSDEFNNLLREYEAKKGQDGVAPLSDELECLANHMKLLNKEGIERLLEYSDDLVASKKYIKNGENVLGVGKIG